ncbi:MAG: ATPase domain-containing protein, partial [Thermoplasmata archaeon]
MLEGLANISGLLLKGPPGVGKLEWCLELIDDFLEHDKKIVIVCIDYSPESIRQRGFKFDIDLRKYEGENLVFVDCFSAPLGKHREEDRAEGTMYVSSLSNIEQIGMNITKASDVLGDPINLFF